MIATYEGYSWNNQGIFLYLIFLEHYFGIITWTLLGTFSLYTENISWECSTNIPWIYIYPVVPISLFFSSVFIKNVNVSPIPFDITLWFQRVTNISMYSNNLNLLTSSASLESLPISIKKFTLHNPSGRDWL